ncbi:ommochrome-binding protein-like [Leguminivora glycinivorella]|uniref:ommochrome-binding protein-like n=1 Tax=Leguminivora glycinivorella TaxID=1035111 RepID=UPI00200E1B44|nr:ommochrome-binding protein-like [Leguminivora glycinivorella]
MLKLITTLALLAVCHAHIIKPACDLLSIQNIIYQKEVLKENVNEPYQMAIDYNTNTLFFSYSAVNPTTEATVFEQAYLNLKTKEFNSISGIIGGFAATVDNTNNNVYLGGRNGIYAYDYEKNKATHVNPNGYSIWQMFFKDKLYYTAYPQERVYTFEDGNSIILPELSRTMVQLVALDNDLNMYFSNSSGLFLLNKSDNVIAKLGEYTINSFTADINGNLYFSTPSGFYKIDKKNVLQLADVDDVFGLVVDGDNNLIYGSGDKIIRLSATTKTNCF